MANVKTTLTVAGNGTSNTFSNSKTYTEETVTKFYVDNTEIFTDLIVFSPDDESPAKTATSTGAPKSFCIYNSGTTGVEIQIQNTSWTHGAPDTVDSEAVFWICISTPVVPLLYIQNDFGAAVDVEVFVGLSSSGLNAIKSVKASLASI